MAKGDPKARLRELIAALPATDFSSDTAIEEAIKALAAKNGLGFGDYQAVARLAVSGTNAGPSITGHVSRARPRFFFPQPFPLGPGVLERDGAVEDRPAGSALSCASRVK